MPASKPPLPCASLRPALLEPRHRRSSAASGLNRKPADDRRGARVCRRFASRRPCRRRIRGMAGEDAAAARRVAGTFGVERTGDGEQLEMRQSGPVEVVDGAAEVGLQTVGTSTRAPWMKADGHFVRTGFDGHAHAQAGIDGVAGIGGLFEERWRDRRGRRRRRGARAGRRWRIRPDARRRGRA